jgi:hypothetical protein
MQPHTILLRCHGRVLKGKTLCILTRFFIFLIFKPYNYCFCLNFRYLFYFVSTIRISTAIMKASKLWILALSGILMLWQPVGLFAATRQEIKSAIEAARQDLRISIATEERIASELEKHKKSGNAAPDVIEDYELYLSRVQAMVSENRAMVAKLEALNARYDIRNAPAGTAYRVDTEVLVNPKIPEEQVVDQLAVLDRQLDSSLAEFDEALLKELDLIREKSSERMRDLSAEAEAAAQRLRDKGIDIDGTSEEESADSELGSTEEQKAAEKDEGATEAGKENQSPEGKEEGELAASQKSPQGVEGSKSHPRNRYDPKDDDIVARQLREAAEKETDPELREKLWKEYEQYKTNTAENTSTR